MRVTGLGAETARLNTLGGQWCVCLIRIAPSPGGVSATACPGGGSRHRPIRLDSRGEGGGGGWHEAMRGAGLTEKPGFMRGFATPRALLRVDPTQSSETGTVRGAQPPEGKEGGVGG